MRVLLISPLPGLDPACGDVTYTQTLLGDPPVGVEYVTYADALASGELVEHARRKRFRQEPFLTSAAKTINILRGRGVLFWEPFRFFSVKPGRFDLIHMHVFAGRFLELPCPLVVSVGAPQRLLYLDARNQSRARVRASEFAEVALCRMMGVNSGSHHLPQAERLLTYTQFARDWFGDRGVFPRDRIDVVPIFMRGGAPHRLAEVVPRRIGFVAKDFRAKGGPALLAAFKRVRQSRPDAELIIVGCEPELQASELEAQGVQWLPYVPRERLLSELLPSFDVFAYPTTCDCISYVLLEAMAQGIALATSDYPSMPEAVDFGRAGMVSAVGDAEKMANNILQLLEPSTNRRYRAAALERFRTAYSADAVRPKLKDSYDAALAQWSRACA